MCCLGDLAIYGRIIFKMNLKETVLEDVDWILLTQDLEKWRAPTNTTLRLRVP